MTVTAAQSFRLSCRSTAVQSPTSGICQGYAQANLIVVPGKLAADFQDLCFRNPVPCPLLSKVTDPKSVEDARIISAGSDFDVRYDIPLYAVYKKGKLIDTKTDIAHEWTDDHVGFLIGCSFSFEKELARNQLQPKHQTLGQNVAMYVTTKLLDPAGVFVNCPYVVSMRPYKQSEVDRVRRVTGAFKKTHGEPIDWGYDALQRLGIKDLARPEYGDAIELADDEVPVFWGCGVTPQAAVMAIGGQFEDTFMAHAPGHMLVLDVTDEEIKKL